MAEYAKSVNPEILRWARERSGHSLEEVAHALKKDVSVVESWEAGERFPAIGQLEKLAYELYKRPLAIFFFPEVPEEKTPAKEFRTLPQFEIEKFAPDTLYALREARAMQLSLRDLTDGTNPAVSSRSSNRVMPGTTVIMRLAISRQGSGPRAPRKIRRMLYWGWVSPYSANSREH